MWLGVVAYFVCGLAWCWACAMACCPSAGLSGRGGAGACRGSIGLPVEIASLSADWQGLHPSFRIGGLTIKDAAGQPALTLQHVEAEPAWRSLLLFRLRLNRLEIDSPDLSIRRGRRRADLRGRSAGQNRRRQRRFCRLAARPAPDRDSATRASNGATGCAGPTTWCSTSSSSALKTVADHHRFGLRAQPPARLAAALEVRGDLRGRNPARPAETWRGELYASLDYAALGAWRAVGRLPAGCGRCGRGAGVARICPTGG
jgi:hypothetical protein